MQQGVAALTSGGTETAIDASMISAIPNTNAHPGIFPLFMTSSLVDRYQEFSTGELIRILLATTSLSADMEEQRMTWEWEKSHPTEVIEWNLFSSDHESYSINLLFLSEQDRRERSPLKGGSVMTARRFFMFFVVVLFFLGLASQALSSVVGEEVKGTVTKIDGENVSIKDFMGDEKTVTPKNPEALKDLKVGDRAMRRMEY